MLACGGVATEEAPPLEAPAASGLQQLASRFETFDCTEGSSDPHRSWCPVASAGEGSFTAPDGVQIRLVDGVGTYTGQGGPTEIVRVQGEPWGDAYVVVEEVSDGHYVSVFPNADLVALGK